jgi:hypothetical protein
LLATTHQRTGSEAAGDSSRLGKPRTHPVLRQTEAFTTRGCEGKSWDLRKEKSDPAGPVGKDIEFTITDLTEKPGIAISIFGASDAAWAK